LSAFTLLSQGEKDGYGRHKLAARREAQYGVAVFYKRGYIDGFGHISARTEDLNKIRMTLHVLGVDSRPENFVEIGLQAGQEGCDVQLPGELPIHLEVF
jgi:hypothetical protein